jgi:hypothetical protein
LLPSITKARPWRSVKKHQDIAQEGVAFSGDPQACTIGYFAKISSTRLKAFWAAAMSAFEECLSATSTRQAPWYVVPADDKENARLIVSQIILDTLNGLEMTYPHVSDERRQELEAIRERLIKGDLD